MASQNLSAVFTDAQALLNDVSKQMWPDAILQNYVPKAHKELQLKLWLNGLPVIKEVSAIITVPAGAVNLGVNLPTDLIEPRSMGERDASLTTGVFTPMKELSLIPLGEAQVDTLRFWCWREEIIELLGATQDVKVELTYTKGITVPANANASIGFIFGELYLAPRIAALAAGSLGNTSLYNTLTVDANSLLDTIFAANIKGMQGLGSRRIPYRRGRKIGRIY